MLLVEPEVEPQQALPDQELLNYTWESVKDVLVLRIEPRPEKPHYLNLPNLALQRCEISGSIW